MITINLGTIEYYDDESNEFILEEGGIVRFEYSLKTLYDWESKWRKPFLKGGLTGDELLDFYKKMAMDPMDYKFMTVEVVKQLSDYIKNADTATKFGTNNDTNEKKTNGGGKLHTAEEIYALMFAAGIPLEFEHRNLNRLLIVLRIIGSYNEPPKKMSKQEIFKQNASLNAQRKAEMKTKG